MVTAAIVATALNTAAARRWGVLVDALDVAAEPDTTKRYGCDPATLALKLAGPGGVSSLRFEVDDPQGLLSFTDGQIVRVEDYGRDVTWFRGFLESYSARPLPPLGRTWTITAVGVEVLLDWYVTTAALSFPVGTDLPSAVQAVIASASGIGEIRALADPFNIPGSDALPIGMHGSILTTAVSIDPFTVLREALAQLSTGVAATPNGAGTYLNIGPGFIATVDHRLGLRAWQLLLSGPGPVLNAVDTTAGTQYHGSNPTAALDAAAIVRAVVVKGTGVTVTVTDGTGLRGRTAVLSDATLTTTAAATAAGIDYLAGHVANLSGAIGLDYDTAPVGAHTETSGAAIVLGKIGLTDPNLVTGSVVFPIASADVNFFADKVDVRVAYGVRRSSGAQLIRQLTRGTLS